MDPDFSSLAGFDWNKGNQEHIKKHKVKQTECEEIFYSKPLIVSFDKAHSQIEERFEVLGKTNKKRKLFLVYTMRGGKIRVLSCRDQNKKERKTYDQKEGGENEKT